MNLKSCGAVAVFAAMVACASTVSAQGTVGKGSLGGSLGLPFFLADQDTKEGQSPRLLGLANFQYCFSDQVRLATSFGFGWVGYKEGTLAPYPLYGPSTPDGTTVRDLLLTKFVPVSLTMIRSFKPQGEGWVPYAGAGVNLTRLEIVNDQDKIKDPVTFDSYVNWAPGVQARAGTEYFLGSNNNVAFDWNAHWSYLFSKNEEQFPSGFTGPHSYFSVNFGVNVYFWPIGYKSVETAKDPEAQAPAVAPEATEPGLPPPPAPDPAPPTPPETPSAPDTTKAPPVPQTKSVAVVKAPSAKPVVAAQGSTATSCPLAPIPGASGGGGGMLGIPGSPPVEGDAPTRTPQPDASPEGRPTP